MDDRDDPQPRKPKRRFLALELNRQLLGAVGLIVGFVVYQAAQWLPAPWSAVMVGLCFVALGAVAWWYARGERWIQVIGIVLAAYGVVRMFLK